MTVVLPLIPAVLKLSPTFWLPPADGTDPDVADVLSQGRSLGEAQSETASVIVQLSGSLTSVAMLPIASVSEAVLPSSSVFE